MKNYIKLLLVFIFVIGVLLGVILRHCTYKCPPNNAGQLQPDTVLVYEIKYQSDTVFKKGKIRYRIIIDSLLVERKDTIKILTKPFTVTDTLITKKRDTIETNYSFPENIFTHKIGYKSDSIRVIINTITIKVPGTRSWWIDPALGGAGLVLGYLLGASK